MTLAYSAWANHYPPAKDRVAAGVKYLDQHAPEGWRNRITRPLSMGNPICCVISQIYDTLYWDALVQLFASAEPQSEEFPEFGTGHSARERGMELGLNINPFSPSETFDELADQWIVQAGLKVDRVKHDLTV